jgi:hypothetical protein
MKKKIDVHHSKTLRTLSPEDLGNVRGGDEATLPTRPEFAPGTPADVDYGIKQKNWVPA